MPIHYDLKKLFSVDATYPEEAQDSDGKDLMDEILITGLPENFPSEHLAKLISHECLERGVTLPGVLWQSASTQDDRCAILYIFEKEMPRNIITDALIECIEELLEDMTIALDDVCYHIKTDTAHNYDSALAYIQKHYPGPDFSA
jgi:hypothetical protein